VAVELARGDARGVGAEEELEQRGLAQLGGRGAGIGEPPGQRLPAGVGDRVMLASAAALLLAHRHQAGGRQAVGLGVELRVGDRPEVAHRAGVAGLELVRRGLAREAEQAEDDVRGRREGWCG